MRAYVDQTGCIGCGLCNSICPEVFSMNEHGKSQPSDEELSNVLLAAAQKARDSCPVSVIDVY